MQFFSTERLAQYQDERRLIIAAVAVLDKNYKVLCEKSREVLQKAAGAAEHVHYERLGANNRAARDALEIERLTIEAKIEVLQDFLN